MATLRFTIFVALCLSHSLFAQDIQFFGKGEAGFADVARSKRAVFVQTSQFYSDPTAKDPLASVIVQAHKALQASGADWDDAVRIQLYLAPELEVGPVLNRLGKLIAARPTVSFVSTRFGNAKTQLAMDVTATVSQGKEIRSGMVSSTSAKSLVYISGQAARGNGDLHSAAKATLKDLQRTLEYLKLSQQNTLQLKCFLTPMAEVAEAKRAIKETFGTDVPTTFVEWKSSLPIEIELVAAGNAAREPASDSVVYLTPPWMKSSPVFSRVAELRGVDRIFVGSLTSDRQSSNEQVADVFAKLKRALVKVQSDERHLVKATYYVSNSEVSSNLNKIRPSVYHPNRPPAASKAMVLGTALSNSSLSMDFVAAPKSEK